MSANSYFPPELTIVSVAVEEGFTVSLSVSLPEGIEDDGFTDIDYDAIAYDVFGGE